jgi:DNA-binding NtrC family response regulator
METTRALRSAVLIVEDDPIIRWSGVETLGGAGFDVLEAGDASEALALLEAHGGSIGVLFTDVDMPGPIDGLELARIASLRWPCMHIIIASGRRTPQPRSLPDNGRFIPKPYAPEQIVRDIDAMLAA